MTIHEVSENVFLCTANSNTTALVLPTRVVIIDAGNIPSMVEIRNEIEAISNKKVDTVILTHFHSDHTRATPVFSDCTIISSTLLLKRLKEAKRKPPEGYELTFPNKTFYDQIEIQDGAIRLIVKQTGGHTDDSTYVYCPTYSVLATGDNLIVNIYPFAGKGCNPDLWIQALKAYLSCDVNSFIPGHGPVAGKDEVKEFLDYMVEVRSVMKELIAGGGPKEDVLKTAGDIEYCYYIRNPEDQYYRRWKKQYLSGWYNVWKKEL